MPFTLTMATAIEVAVLWIAVYGVLRFLRGSRGFGLLRGLTSFALVSFISYQALQATVGTPVLAEILTAITGYLVLIIFILFQQEVRQGLARVGSTGILGIFNRKRTEDKTLQAIASAAVRMSRERVGALIAFERAVSLANIRDSAVPVEGNVTGILLETIFFPGSPLHDGGVIIQNDKVLAAACIFPLTTNPDVQRRMGTRHRAGIGLTEETDAVTLIVSEETGHVSLASNGRLFEAVPVEELENRLRTLLREQRDPVQPATEESASTPEPAPTKEETA